MKRFAQVVVAAFGSTALAVTAGVLWHWALSAWLRALGAADLIADMLATVSFVAPLIVTATCAVYRVAEGEWPWGAA